MPRPNLIAVFRNTYRQTYDIVAKQNGLVEAKALDPQTYVAPNGASMRPNSVYQQSLVSWRFRGSDVIVYSVPQGTSLPDDLVLVHERTDHYSLQPAEQMTIDNLNTKITEFLRANAEVFTRERWLKAYPEATESS
ncbi:hypothetical protein E4U19_002965 [Claviceps sp. Clav32 group G5]|nr:hypothetical protein E4U19_002965 [Claviceps sp. Clav32 group G5]